MHNQVNESLKKEIFDCSNIGDFYDCGCAEDEKYAAASAEVRSAGVDVDGKPEMSAETKERLTGASGRDFNMDLLTGNGPVRLEKEG